jgi:hypothetical protein
VNYPYATIPNHYPNGTTYIAALGNSVYDWNFYNNRFQPNRLVTQNQASATIKYTDRHFSFVDGNGKNNGNLVRIDDSLRYAGGQRFAYDQLNRISSGLQIDNVFNETFSYDPWGNLTQSGTAGSGGAFNVQNQLTSSTVGSCAKFHHDLLL